MNDTDVPPIDTINWILGGGAGVTMAIALWGVVTGRWITRGHYDEMLAQSEKRYQEMKAERDAVKAERDQWIAHVISFKEITGTAVETTKAIVRKGRE